MERWFIDFAFDTDKEIEAVPALTAERIARQFGDVRIETGLRTFADTLFKFTDSDLQVTFAMYICGYPKEMIDKLGDVKQSALLKQVDALIPRASVRLKAAKIGARALRGVKNDFAEFDSRVEEIETKENEDFDEQLLGTTISVDPMKDYLKRIGRRQLLTAEEEVELAKGMEAGALAGERLENTRDTLSPAEVRELQYLMAQGERAFSVMTEANLRLVVSIASRYRLRVKHLSQLDLIQEGNAGLLRAVHKFDYTKGFKFSTYATWWIRQAVTRAIADTDKMVRIPVHKHELISSAMRAGAELEAMLGRKPTNEEIGLEIEKTAEQVAELLSHKLTHVSLNTKLGDDGDTEFGDILTDSSAYLTDENVYADVMKNERQAYIEDLFSMLEDRDREILKMRWGIGREDRMTLDAIGEVLNLTRERVRQIELRAMNRVRQKAEAGGASFPLDLIP